MTQTTTYTLTFGQLLTRSLQILGALSSMAPGQAPTADQIARGIVSYNLMLMGFQRKGINLYRQTQISVAVAAGAGAPAALGGTPIVVTPQILGLEDARWVTVSTVGVGYNERPMGVFQYGKYMTLPNKFATSNSGPSVVTFDKQVSASNLYVWPLPTFAGTLNATVGRSVECVSAYSDACDFPQEWTEGMMYSLADRLMDDGGIAASDPQTADRITKHAGLFIQDLENFDRPSSVFMQPWGKRGQGRLYR